MSLHFTTLLACIAAITTIAVALPYEDPLPSLASDCIHAIHNLDFSSAQELYSKVKQNNLLDSSAFYLAAAMKETFQTFEFQQLSTEEKRKLEDLKAQLPVSVRNVQFGEIVCMLSVERTQYLYAPGSDFTHDPENRHAFLWRLGGILPGSTWTFNGTMTPTDYRITNIYGEHLYAANTHTYLNRRNVYTYMNEFSGIPSDIWRLKADGDNVIIQNTWYAGSGETIEYLYAAANLYNYDSTRGTIFSWDKDWGNGIINKDHLWRLQDCKID